MACSTLQFTHIFIHYNGYASLVCHIFKNSVMSVTHPLKSPLTVRKHPDGAEFYIFLSGYIMYKLGLYTTSEIGLKISNLKKQLMKIVKLMALQT